jgi:hypothetical protein
MTALTARMKEAQGAIVGHVARHGVMPSRAALAALLGTYKNNACRLVACLIERGALTRVGQGTEASLAFGSGTGVMLPPHVAASLAKFATAQGEDPERVAADAIILHIDALEAALTDKAVPA